MATTINASTSNGLIQTADTSGVLELQSGGTAIASVSSTGVAVTGEITATGQIAAIKSETAQATTSGTAKDFTSIPSWVKRITVVLSNVSGSGSSNWLFQLGTSSGITTTGYVSTSMSPRTTSQQTNSTAGYVIINPGIGATESISGLYTIANLSGNTWVSSGMSTSSTQNICLGAGTVTLASALTTLRFTYVNGTDTFDAGSVNILYE